MTTEVSVPECLAIRVLQSADVRLWCANGEFARGLTTEARPATDPHSIAKNAIEWGTPA